jgi:hypothetical protein
VAAARVVHGFEELMMISAGGIVIRTPLETISERAGRATSGVILMNLRDGDRLAAIAILEPSTNGNGDDPDALDSPGVEVIDEDVLSALPSQSDIAASEAEAEDDVEDVSDDEEDALDADDDASSPLDH